MLGGWSGITEKKQGKEKVLLTNSPCFLRGRKTDFWVLLDCNVFFFFNEEKRHYKKLSC